MTDDKGEVCTKGKGFPLFFKDVGDGKPGVRSHSSLDHFLEGSVHLFSFLDLSQTFYGDRYDS